MVYSYTQISQYLRCLRSYRFRYFDGWRQKETRSVMAFGHRFESALAAYFREEDCGAALFREWTAYRDTAFEYKKAETWDRLLHQGIHLLERFAQDDRVHIRDPRQDLQIKQLKALPGGSEFVAYLDAIGVVDGVRCSGSSSGSGRILISLRQQAEHGHAVGRANIDSPIRDHRRDEFVARELVATVSGLVGVVELGRKIRGIVSVKHGGTPVFNRPHNAVGNAVGGNAWRRSRIRKRG